MKVVHARHEHCAVAMADGYARATGKVGVASTTCGPGFTQIMTALTIAARGNVPLVVFAGDSPLAAAWYLQQIDMAPLALACGAHYVTVKHIDRLLDNVREAFLVAQLEQKPVVLSVPMDLQKQAWPHLTDYTPSADLAAGSAAAGARSRDRRSRRRHDRRGGEADPDRRPRRPPVRRRPGARGARRARPAR
jgi:thiamine pyrophosphate-dependent acetolactate synthase large subunit-like protein